MILKIIREFIHCMCLSEIKLFEFENLKICIGGVTDEKKTINLTISTLDVYLGESKMS